MASCPAFFTLLGDFFKGILAVLVGRWIFSLMGVTAFDAGYLAGFFGPAGSSVPGLFWIQGRQRGADLAGNHPGGQPAGAADFTDYLFAGAVHHPNRFAGVDHRAMLYPFITLIVDLCLRRPVLFDFLFAALFSVIVIYKHRENIKRLLNGTERRIGDKKPSQEPSEPRK